MAEIVLRKGDTIISRLELTENEVAMGRDPRCQLVIPSPDVSRRHARLLLKDGIWRVEDLGSSNGTRVNGELVTARTLSGGDMLQLGDHEVYFYEEASGLVPIDPVLSPLPDEESLASDTMSRRALSAAEIEEARLSDQSVVFDLNPSDLQDILIGVKPGAGKERQAQEAGSERLAALFDIGQTIETGTDFRQVLATIMDKALAIMGAERGFLMLEDPASKDLRTHVARDHKGDIVGVEAEKISRTILRRVRETGKPVVIMDTGSGEWNTQSILDNRIHSALGAPLFTRGTVTGVLYVDHRSQALMFTKEDVAFFTTFAYQAKAVIDNSRAYWDLVESLFKASDDFVVVCSPLGRINLVNRAGTELLDMTTAEITSKSLADLVPAADRAKAEQLVRDTLKSGVASGREVQLVPKDGRPVPMSVSSFTMRDRGGNPTGLCLIGRDLSDQKFLIKQLERRTKFIQKTFGRYLSDDIVENILETHEGLELGGEKRKVTILMSDLRGFTALAERLAPEQVVAILNNYLGTMADIILKYQGTIDEFIGDAILAIFGAPILRPDDTLRATACAAAMQMAMDDVNRRNIEEGLPALDMGIGLNTGEVVVGNIGSHKRAKYGVVGSVVNTTSRIESFTIGGQVLISEATLLDGGDAIQVSRRLSVMAKGNKEPITVYELRAVGEPYDLVIPDRSETYRAIAPPIRARYSVLAGKHMGDTEHDSMLVKLSERGAEVETGGPGASLDNIKMVLLADDGSVVASDVYAKITEREGERSPHFLIRFTSVPEAAAALLKSAHDRAEGGDGH